MSKPPQTISVIIPTLDEEALIARCIDGLGDAAMEVIVADGGSADMTVELAAHATRIVRSSRGRGVQLNAGAAGARGDILLFLHADTRLESGWAEVITNALRDDAVIGGAFLLKLDSPRLRYRLVEGWVRLRCALLKLPYGDQGIFIRRDTFEALGGYRDIPIMEDVEIVGRMKRAGRLVMLGGGAYTSVRRWAKKGLVRTALKNQMTMALYRLGVSPKCLARFYCG